MGDYVGLNVGGKIYKTSRATLTLHPNSFFAAMLEGGVPSAKDDQGNYLIDRDGETFRHVLNFLRSGELVLPERFSEFTLLEREADFFLLHDLKLSIRKLLSTKEGIGLLFDDGKLFNTTRETLMREDNSFFTKMLNGEIEVARDPQGSYIMDRDGRLFHHIMSYLRHGGIFSAIRSEDLGRLEEEAKYFGLPVLVSHVKSIQLTRGNSSRVDVYYSTISACVGYGSFSSESRQREIQRFSKTYKIIEYVHSVVVDLHTIKKEGSPTIEDVIRFLQYRMSLPFQRTVQEPLTANCIRLQFQS